MKFLESLIISLSMYSAIPMPRVDWREDNMRWSLGCLPLVGILCGGVVYAWARLAIHLHANSLFFAVIATAIPLFISGGLHMDGFLDATDAIFSRRDREKKLEIMKDPHCGPFSVLNCCGLLIIECGAWCQIYSKPLLIPTACIIYTFSRSLVVMVGSYIPYTTSSTLGSLFADRAAHGVRALGIVEIILSILLLCFSGYWNSSFTGLLSAIATIVVMGLFFLWYRRKTLHDFGGITGDLLGYFTELSQLIMLVILAFSSFYL